MPYVISVSPALSKTKRSLDSRMAAGRFYNIIGQVDQQLSEAAFRGSIVAKYGGEGGIAERLGEALPEGFAGSGVIAESRVMVSVARRTRECEG